MAALKPELSFDPHLKDTCAHMENELRSQNVTDIYEQRKEIMRLISDYGFSAQELNFEPDKYIRFNVKSSQQGFSISLTDREESAEK